MAEPLRLHWAALILVLSGPALESMVAAPIAPALPAIADHFAAFGDGPFLAQLAMTVPAAVAVVGAPLAALLAQRIGLRLTLIGCLALFLIAGLIPAAAPGLGVFIAARTILGFAAGGISTCYLMAAASNFDGDARERVLGFCVASGSIAAVASSNFGGLLTQQFGWSGPFLIYAATLPVLVLALMARDWSPASDDAAKAELESHAWLPALRAVGLIYLLLLLLSICLFLPPTQGPFLLKDGGVDSPAIQGTLLSMTTLLSTVAALGFGYVRRVLSSVQTLALTCLLLGGGFIVLSLVKGVVAFGVVLALIGLGQGLVFPNVSSMVLRRVPESLRPQAAGMLSSTLFLALFLAPVATDIIRTSLGIAAVFQVVGAVVLVVGLGALLRGGRTPAAASAK